MALRPRDRLLRKLKEYDQYRARHDELFSDRHIRKSYMSLAYEMAFLSGFVAFERFIEEQFLFLLLGKPLSTGRKAPRRIAPVSESIARSIVYGGRSYVDWMPYERTSQRAEVFFREGYPFKRIDAADKQIIERMGAIRNAIAHQSAHAQKRFVEVVSTVLVLRPKERRPSVYLRSSFSAGVTHFENEMGSLIRISKILDS